MSTKPKVLIADHMHASILEMLLSIGYEPVYMPEIARDELKVELTGSVGLIIRSKTVVDADLLTSADKLKFIARAGAGMDLIDVEFARKKNIQLLNAPEGNRDAVAEHVIGMLLSLMHNIRRSSMEVSRGLWKREENRGFELKGKTVGIIGFGNMGSSLARKLAGFDCRILAYDKNLPGYSRGLAEEVSLVDLQQQAEILSLHVPLTPETSRWIDRKFLSNMPRLMYVVNTARGEILILKDLLGLLQAGQIKGACLDVLENEKLMNLKGEDKSTFEALSNIDNVIMSPHIAGWTFESYKRINEVLVKKISALNS